jgi:hypothetical protein
MKKKSLILVKAAIYVLIGLFCIACPPEPESKPSQKPTGTPTEKPPETPSQKTTYTVTFKAGEGRVRPQLK